MYDKEKLQKIYEGHVEKGFELLPTIDITNPNYETVCVNLMQAIRTADQLKQEIEFDKSGIEIKNEDVTEDDFVAEECINCENTMCSEDHSEHIEESKGE